MTLFGDSGCFLPLYVAPFSDEQVQHIQRYQQHTDFIGVLCYTCTRKDKMNPAREGMTCPNCGAVYSWAYGMLTPLEAEAEAPHRYNRPLHFADSADLKLRQWELE